MLQTYQELLWWWFASSSEATYLVLGDVQDVTPAVVFTDATPDVVLTEVT